MRCSRRKAALPVPASASDHDRGHRRDGGDSGGDGEELKEGRGKVERGEGKGEGVEGGGRRGGGRGAEGTTERARKQKEGRRDGGGGGGGDGAPWPLAGSNKEPSVVAPGCAFPPLLTVLCFCCLLVRTADDPRPFPSTPLPSPLPPPSLTTAQQARHIDPGP